MDRLVELYAEMSAITSPVCAKQCTQDRDKPTRCCERKYCELARQFAKERYGLELEETGHPELPFMGSSGCTIAPHLRPICTLHACPISYAPVSNIDNDSKRTQEYFNLRHKILTESKSTHKEIIWPTSTCL